MSFYDYVFYTYSIYEGLHYEMCKSICSENQHLASPFHKRNIETMLSDENFRGNLPIQRKEYAIQVQYFIDTVIFRYKNAVTKIALETYFEVDFFYL